MSEEGVIMSCPTSPKCDVTSPEYLELYSCINLASGVYKTVFPDCSHLSFSSEEYWECYVRHMAFTIYHPVGTAAMGTVLDARLRVKGVKRLRVADGSVMPRLVGGNTNAPIIMIGEKAAAMIMADYELSKKL